MRKVHVVVVIRPNRESLYTDIHTHSLTVHSHSLTHTHSPRYNPLCLAITDLRSLAGELLERPGASAGLQHAPLVTPLVTPSTRYGMGRRCGEAMCLVLNDEYAIKQTSTHHLYQLTPKERLARPEKRGEMCCFASLWRLFCSGLWLPS